MTPATLAVVVSYLALVALVAVLAALGANLGPALRAGIVVAEVALVVQAVLDIAGQVRGHRPGDLPTHLGYLAVSIVILPIVIGRSARIDAGRDAPAEPVATDHVLVALGRVVAVVVTVRMHMTWAER